MESTSESITASEAVDFASFLSYTIELRHNHSHSHDLYGKNYNKQIGKSYQYIIIHVRGLIEPCKRSDSRYLQMMAAKQLTQIAVQLEL